VAPEKFVVRLLDAAGELLAWAPVYASARPHPRGASCPLKPQGPTTFVIERDGIAAQVSVHWCHYDVARVQAIAEPVAVTAGQVFTFMWIEPVWLVPGMRDVPLPAVTERGPVLVGPPAGGMMARAS
jgi:hypothetical protein